MTPSKLGDGGEVIVECALDATPEQVWRALTIPELAADWLDAAPAAGKSNRTCRSTPTPSRFAIHLSPVRRGRGKAPGVAADVSSPASNGGEVDRPQGEMEWGSTMRPADMQSPSAAEGQPERSFEIVEAIPFSRLTYRWREGQAEPTESFVTVELSPGGPKSTWFRLTHRPPQRLVAANSNAPMARAA